MTALTRKLKIQLGQHIVILNPPPGYEILLGSTPIHGHKSLIRQQRIDFLQVFIHSLEELEHHSSTLQRHIQPETVLWISYPKTTTRQTSPLNRNTCWEMMKRAGYRAVAQFSINPEWSAMQYMIHI